jgi:translation initiation factor 3 subunit D
MTDVAAAAIMCSSKAVFSWDLVLKKIQNFVFIQKREEENILDWETLGETAQQDMQPLDIDGVNGARFIMKEAAVTQKDFQYFSQNRAKFTDMAEPIELEVED